MKKSLWHDLRFPRDVAVGCTLALATACSGTVSDSSGGPSASSGSSSSAQGSTSSSGSGSTSGTGSSTGTTTGAGGAGGSTIDTPIVPYPDAPFVPATAMLRRLTRTQFSNAMRDIFGATVNTADLDADSWNGNFAVIGASTIVTSDRGAEQYNTAIESAVNKVFDDATARGKFLGCTPGTGANDTCVRGYLQKLGARAWRRPLETAELDRLTTLSSTISTQLTAAVEGARWATIALFESPNFLYRPEAGRRRQRRGAPANSLRNGLAPLFPDSKYRP